MTKRSFLFVLTTPVLFGLACSSSPVVKELEDFCKVANEIDRLPISADEKLAKIASRKSEYVHAAAPQPSSVWAKLEQAPADQRYGLLTEAAKAAGKGEWTCKPYDRMLKQAEAARLIREQRERDEKEKQAAAAAAAKSEEEKKQEPPVVAKKHKKAKHKKHRR